MLLLLLPISIEVAALLFGMRDWHSVMVREGGSGTSDPCGACMDTLQASGSQSP